MNKRTRKDQNRSEELKRFMECRRKLLRQVAAFIPDMAEIDPSLPCPGKDSKKDAGSPGQQKNQPET